LGAQAGAQALAAGAQQVTFLGAQQLGLQQGGVNLEMTRWNVKVLPSHGRMMVGLQQRGWHVGAQPQLFSAPHLPPNEKRPA
jgi:hypothetical protein